MRSELLKNISRIVVKVGTGVLTDSRKKPEIMAPGTHVTGGVGQNVKTMAGNGTSVTCFDGTGVCLLAKRLGDGKICWPDITAGGARLSAAQLQSAGRLLEAALEYEEAWRPRKQPQDLVLSLIHISEPTRPY